MLNVIISKCEPGDERDIVGDMVKRFFGAVRIERSEYGKPFFADYPDKQFNLSHSPGYSALAFCGNPVGIDIECLSRIKRIKNIERFIERTFSDEERCKVDNLYDVLDIWTRKEAVIKLDGRGFAYGLRSFSVFDLNGINFIQPYYDGEALCTIALSM